MLIILSPLLTVSLSLGAFSSSPGDCIPLILLRVDNCSSKENHLGSLRKKWLSDLSEKLLPEHSFYLPISCRRLRRPPALFRHMFYHCCGICSVCYSQPHACLWLLQKSYYQIPN